MTYRVTDLAIDEDRLARICKRYIAGDFVIDEHFVKAVLRIAGPYDPIYRTELLYRVEKTIMRHLCTFWIFCDERCRYKNRREWFEDVRDWVLLETINNPLYNKTIGKRGEIGVGMRFDIMKRDDFSCQICGATQSDGVKLTRVLS